MTVRSRGGASLVTRFDHPALFYDGAEDYVAGLVPFLRGGLSADEAVFVCVPAANVALLTAGLGEDADLVHFADMGEVGRNPARIISAIADFVADHAGRRVRFVGEPIWAGRSPEETREATRHEALLNLAFADTPMTILCPYDVRGLHRDVLLDAQCTHPVLLQAGRRRASPAYEDAGRLPSGCEAPLPSPPSDAALVRFDREGLPRLRRLVRQAGEQAGVGADRADDLALAVNELATNTLSYTGAGGEVRLWGGGRKSLVCEVRDRGHITDPLAGRTAASEEAEGGRGLWMINQLCDLTEVRTGPTGTTIRLHVAPRPS